MKYYKGHSEHYATPLFQGLRMPQIIISIELKRTEKKSCFKNLKS